MHSFQHIPLLNSVRRVGGVMKRYMFPTPEVAAWRDACRQAQRVPRYTLGEINLAGYRIGYTDLLTICPQWHDIFVRQSLRFEFDGASPRILDCGANIGLTSLFFKRLYPNARITAYEADPAIAQVMQKNFDRNGAADIEAVQAAVWVNDGTISFCSEGSDSGAIDTFSPKDHGENLEVPSIRLREVLAREQIDVLKLDIESAELAVLQDCSDVLRNVSTLLLDVHEFDPQSRSLSAIADLLAASGFVYSLDELNPLPWREPVADNQTPFPGKAMCWAMLVRAWRPALQNAA